MKKLFMPNHLREDAEGMPSYTITENEKKKIAQNIYTASGERDKK